ncbi:perilipin-1 isoform X2 [Chanos chanos]|uniref:Perilipin-1 isoform X2 n=1 Tax=Chanos chanos TaxID=29144 RepID=A0A6J2WVD8_CHACN|nr:perilipin-1 isoform X2 [Chanos chanos]
MASEKKSPSDSLQTEENVFARLLSLPTISVTFEIIEKTYINTKQIHPLVCSVCEVYEKGVRSAGTVAVWSIQPAIHRLEPQLVAANSLACRGLDRIQEKIPALQYPPSELASGIAGVVSSTLQTAKTGITNPIIVTSDTALSLASGGLRLTRTALSDGMHYVLTSKPVRLAEEGTDTVLTLTERFFNYILPASSEEREEERAKQEQASVVRSAGPRPSFDRVLALASVVCRRAYDQTAAQLQRSSSQGRELVIRIPGVSPLAGFAKRSLEAMGSVVLRFPGTVAGSPHGSQQRSAQRDLKSEGQDQTGRVQSLVSGFGQQLQSAYVSVVTGMKNAPMSTFGLAKDGASVVLESLGAARERVLSNIPYYGRIPRRPSKQIVETPSPEKEKETGKNQSESPQTTENNEAEDRPGSSPTQPQSTLGGEVEEPQISEESQQLQKKVVKQIPVHQKMAHGGSHRSVPTDSPIRGGQTDIRS